MELGIPLGAQRFNALGNVVVYRWIISSEALNTQKKGKGIPVRPLRLSEQGLVVEGFGGRGYWIAR